MNNYVKNILSFSLLPSLSLTESMPALNSEIWAFLKHFSYPERYTIYSNWSKSYNKHFMLELKKNNITRETDR